MRVGVVGTNIPSISIVRMSASGGRMAVPVRPSLTGYAQFKHISGTPAGDGQSAVPLSRVQILNRLIENLRAAKPDSPAFSEGYAGSPEGLDALIAEYSAELHRAVNASPEAFGTLGGAASAGLVLDIVA